MGYYDDKMGFFIPIGIDPISLPNQLICLNADPDYLINESNAVPVNGDRLTDFRKYNTDTFNYHVPGYPKTQRAKYSKYNVYNSIYWDSQKNNGHYVDDTNAPSTYDALHNGNTMIYFVFKNLVNDSNNSRKCMCGNVLSTANRGFMTNIVNSGSDRKFSQVIYRGVGGTMCYQLVSNYTWDTATDEPIKVVSIKSELIGKVVGDTVADMYINGAFDNSTIMNKLPSASSATYNLTIGNRPATPSLRMNGYLFDYIAFNGLHDDDTRRGVEKFLMNKYGLLWLSVK